ncbi:hypothetical protein NDU88_001199 [Pleurodeles waltl]|uniref:NADPH oxidase organizer 1 n=1 Tax=Pleurodeles waltl TaxID=8319 RepID=A0AAV7LY06_PLEWA|nr:hypothetical protein NDU88_001199 [Pleurodeles waltl]
MPMARTGAAPEAMNPRSGSSRYPVDARGIGLIQHSREKTYMMSVLWSDGNNILIYRTFEEFKKLNKDLKKRFPIEAGFLKKSERVLPKFKDVPFVFWRARGTNRDMEQLKLLAEYSRDLLQTDAKVSQCDDVTQFYTPQRRDLEPSFHENSVVIMPSDATEGRKEPGRPQPESATTRRITSDRYQCVEDFETKDTKGRPFKAQKGDSLEALLKDTTGWWLVENEEKHLAWFPAPYLKKTGSANEPQRGRESAYGGVLYYAVKAYEAKSPDELSVDVGVVVEVVEKSDNGWWSAWYNGRTGYIPSMFLQPYTNPHQKFHVILNKGIHASTPDLHIASSTLNVAALPNSSASVDDPSQDSSANMRLEGRRKALSKRKSRSLSGLPTIDGSTDQSLFNLELSRMQGNAGSYNPDTISKPIPRPRKVRVAEIEEMDLPLEGHGSLIKRTPAVRKPSHLPSQPSKDSDFDKTSSMSVSDHVLYSSNLDSLLNAPVVPPRPQAHEILKKCTTVTKKAVQKTERQGLAL